MTVSIKDLSLTHFVLPVKFVGCRDNELDTDLTLPLGILYTCIPYSLDQMPWLLFISLFEFVRLKFYLRAGFINTSSCMPQRNN